MFQNCFDHGMWLVYKTLCQVWRLETTFKVQVRNVSKLLWSWNVVSLHDIVSSMESTFKVQVRFRMEYWWIRSFFRLRWVTFPMGMHQSLCHGQCPEFLDELKYYIRRLKYVDEIPAFLKEGCLLLVSRLLLGHFWIVSWLLLDCFSVVSQSLLDRFLVDSWLLLGPFSVASRLLLGRFSIASCSFLAYFFIASRLPLGRVSVASQLLLSCFSVASWSFLNCFSVVSLSLIMDRIHQSHP